MSDRPRGRGRAGRGRAERGAQPPQNVPGQSVAQQRQTERPEGLRDQASARTETEQRYPPKGTGRPTYRTVQQESQGDQPLAQQMLQLAVGGDYGDNGASAGRGTIRGGGRQISEKPEAKQQHPPKGNGKPIYRAVQHETQGDQPLAQQMQLLAISGNNGDNSASAGRGTRSGGGRQIFEKPEREDLLITRPSHINSKKGLEGKAVMLSANYFELTSRTDWSLYKYCVEYAPEEDHTGIRKGLLRVHRERLGGYLFDGSTLFTSQRYNPEPLELFSTNQHTGVQVRITLKLVGDLAPGDYQYLQFFNILIRRCLNHLNLQLVGCNYFDARAKVDIREYKMELWPGYVTSIRQHENSILMCAEITHKVMRNDTCLDLLNECTQNFQSEYKKIFTNKIVGCVVLTAYNNRTYRIDDVDFGVTPTSTFSMRRGENMSYRDYYRNKYHIQIKDTNQPLLVSRSRPREVRAGMATHVYLVPELCQMTGLTDAMRENFQLMRSLAVHTRVGPDLRVKKLLSFSNRLMSETDVRTDLNLWNMGLANNLVEFCGRILPPEKIFHGCEVTLSAGENADFTKNVRDNPMLTVCSLDQWAVLVPPRPRQDAQNFVSTLIKVAAGMLFPIAQPQFLNIPDDRPGTYIDALDYVISNRNPQLVMCVVSNNRNDRYSAIKKKCCVDHTVPTQVIVAKNLASKGVLSIATKVAIQMNCKIGGAPWSVNIPAKGLMVVGFDVCHDTQIKGKSYGALVASLNKAVSRYFSTATLHTNGEELSNFLVANFTCVLHAYKQHNNSLPSKIVFYRDGVGEGQIPYVRKFEVELLNKALTELYHGPVHMAFIIVNKRLNTRIFYENRNPPPGTVVDDTITLPERYDFYVVSQSVRQGTVSPTSYNVIYDNVGLDPDKLQRLTYKMTHLYYNWSGTVRVPAPVQYAHKLAFLTGQSLHRPPTASWDSRLYYL